MTSQGKEIMEMNRKRSGKKKSSIESLSEMPDDVIAKSLKWFKKCRKTNEGDFRLGRINSGTAD